MLHKTRFMIIQKDISTSLLGAPICSHLGRGIHWIQRPAPLMRPDMQTRIRLVFGSQISFSVSVTILQRPTWDISLIAFFKSSVFFMAHFLGLKPDCFLLVTYRYDNATYIISLVIQNVQHRMFHPASHFSLEICFSLTPQKCRLGQQQIMLWFLETFFAGGGDVGCRTIVYYLYHNSLFSWEFKQIL